LAAGQAHLERIVRADHGAQFFTARSERFQSMIAQMSDLGLVREWTRGFPRLGPSGLEQRPEGHPRFVCPPGMTVLGKSIRDGLNGEAPLNVELGAVVTAITRSSHGWVATLETGQVRHGKALVVNAPAPQALNLLRHSLNSSGIEALEKVRFDPCWAVVAALKTRPEPGWKGVEIEHPILAWASLDHTKREADAPPVLVLHATSTWSLEQLEQQPDAVREMLLKAAQDVLGDWAGNSVAAVAHRWRYALPTVTFPGPFWSDENLVVCGDWCTPSSNAQAVGRGTPRIETALESGWASAQYLQGIKQKVT
jgi:renalase